MKAQWKHEAEWDHDQILCVCAAILNTMEQAALDGKNCIMIPVATAWHADLRQAFGGPQGDKECQVCRGMGEVAHGGRWFACLCRDDVAVAMVRRLKEDVGGGNGHH